MDLADLKARALAAREYAYTTQAGPIMTLRVPTTHEMLLVARETGYTGGPQALVEQLLMHREMLARAVVRWAGVKAHHLAPDALEPDALVPCTVDAVRMWLDAYPAEATPMLNTLVEKVAARSQALEAATKN
jgi:hypothetical protein